VCQKCSLDKKMGTCSLKLAGEPDGMCGNLICNSKGSCVLGGKTGEDCFFSAFCVSNYCPMSGPKSGKCAPCADGDCLAPLVCKNGACEM
jgi:hypothetical protein